MGQTTITQNGKDIVVEEGLDAAKNIALFSDSHAVTTKTAGVACVVSALAGFAGGSTVARNRVDQAPWFNLGPVKVG